MSRRLSSRSSTAWRARPAADRWPGLDEAFTSQVSALADSMDGRGAATDGVGIRPGDGRRVVRPRRPLRLNPGWREPLERLVAAYHRLIETIVDAYPHDARLRRVLAWPPSLHPDEIGGPPSSGERVHLLRLDTMPQPDGGLKVLETNANCPGGLGSHGQLAAAWRAALTARGLRLPPPLAAESQHWAGRWFVDLAEREIGRRPGTVALLCPDGGNRNELDVYATALDGLGVHVMEADPREVREDAGRVTIRDEPVRCAYAKIGMQDLARLRPQVEPYLRAVRSGALFVQNGLRGRLIGDNKLCLAVLSDPQFADLFSPADYAQVYGSIPWSRNIAVCAAPTVRAIRKDPDRYVLKRPLDTRGLGVVVGREAADWDAAVDTALAESWLVQEYCTTTMLNADDDAGPLRHDLALGSVNGRLVSVFTRVGTEERLNVARSGRPHPVYV